MNPYGDSIFLMDEQCADKYIKDVTRRSSSVIKLGKVKIQSEETATRASSFGDTI